MALRLFFLRGPLRPGPGGFEVEGPVVGEPDEPLGPGTAPIRTDGFVLRWGTGDRSREDWGPFPTSLWAHARPSREVLVGVPEDPAIVYEGAAVCAASGCIFHLARELPLPDGATLERTGVTSRFKPGYRPPDPEAFEEEWPRRSSGGLSASDALPLELHRNSDVVRSFEWRAGEKREAFELREGERWQRGGVSLAVTKAWLAPTGHVGAQHQFVIELATG